MPLKDIVEVLNPTETKFAAIKEVQIYTFPVSMTKILAEEME